MVDYLKKALTTGKVYVVYCIFGIYTYKYGFESGFIRLPWLLKNITETSFYKILKKCKFNKCNFDVCLQNMFMHT